MAAGRAALASPVGIAADLIAHGETGFHCKTGEDWYKSLLTLYHQRDTCAAFGRRARDAAVARYDSAVAATELHRIFQECLRA